MHCCSPRRRGSSHGSCSVHSASCISKVLLFSRFSLAPNETLCLLPLVARTANRNELCCFTFIPAARCKQRHSLTVRRCSSCAVSRDGNFQLCTRHLPPSKRRPPHAPHASPPKCAISLNHISPFPSPPPYPPPASSIVCLYEPPQIFIAHAHPYPPQ